MQETGIQTLPISESVFIYNESLFISLLSYHRTIGKKILMFITSGLFTNKIRKRMQASCQNNLRPHLTGVQPPSLDRCMSKCATQQASSQKILKKVTTKFPHKRLYNQNLDNQARRTKGDP